MLFSKRAVRVLPALIGATSAASFPPQPTGLSVVNSTQFHGVSISYKETSICETTEGVKGYSGFIHLPPNPAENRNYTVNTYFWYFEARNDAEHAPLSVWLQGGPGVPSITAAVGENGPCSVLPDSKSTELNPWSWNDKVNMLYIDQPVQTGFSYNTLVNGTLNELNLPFVYTPADFFNGTLPETNLTFLTGTFAMPNPNTAPNTTDAAAPIMWHNMQAFLQDFPERKSCDKSFSIWGESYDGHYGPAYADYISRKNDEIVSGNSSGTPIPLDTVGFINPCIDIDTQMPFYPEYAFNNTYGFEAITEEQYAFAVTSTDKCRELSAACKQLADEKDPQGLGNVQEVNKACYGAYDFCFSTMWQNYTLNEGARNVFDIAAPAAPEAFPPKWAAGYFNDAEIQQALGVPLNFTGASAVTMTTFNFTGDFVRGKQLAQLGSLLNRGVKVALVYGDRDYQCNWLGGEALSLAIESKFSPAFAAAKYAEVQTNDSYVGGLVRQHGNLSFSRVFQAGHEVPYYQPETAYQIFNRVMFNQDVASGTVDITDGYSSEGVDSAWTQDELQIEEEVASCYVWDIFETCTPEQGKILASGREITKDFVLIGYVAENGTEILF
ncbi:alpha/beta-hydrolase [Lentithecium fluviatile CBS 122367]|uniref:Alpha/beta-hydrolase n=1 Tax=Lentithecium fluviatile CBS 122367 TaxID=1168545 RepID=A0A6G1J5H4_9PLEO|nr:alpha/beta-hydrolase [Lentithecium fluviatile CBS 122367]